MNGTDNTTKAFSVDNSGLRHSDPGQPSTTSLKAPAAPKINRAIEMAGTRNDGEDAKRKNAGVNQTSG